MAVKKSYVKTTKKAKKARKPRKKESSGFSGMMFIVVAIGGFAVVNPGAAGAIFICMLPTFVLLIGKSDGLQGLRAQCVGYMNAAAAFPFIYTIFNGDATLMHELQAMKIVLIPWGAAVVGTFLQFTAPFMSSSFLQFVADEKLNKVLSTREKLIEEWGPDVVGTPENEKIF